MKQIFSIIVILFLFSACSGEDESQSRLDSKTNFPREIKQEDESASNLTTTNNNRMTNESEVTSKSDSKKEETNLDEEIADYNSHYPTPTVDPEDNIEEEEETNEQQEEEPESDYNFHTYEVYDSFLKKYVSASGKVNYAGINGVKTTLNKIIKEFNEQYPGSDWTHNQKLAFWINTYNLFTIKLIIDNYPTTSITKIAAKPWGIKSVKLKGHTYSLDHVENQIIRKQFNEPRIHFALNCASESCPILLNKAYKASTLSSQLTTQTKKFLNDTSKNTYNKKEITISPIFKWYAADFTKNGSDVIKFINKYRTEQLKTPKIKYSTYSWDLND